ncbi:hypothetical protein BU15DRAFT_77655 [Melanogaster broomeanus]|nr:hypothetical protein BU15DRAFT_77655 [Melanogaster broomeanus]
MYAYKDLVEVAGLTGRHVMLISPLASHPYSIPYAVSHLMVRLYTLINITQSSPSPAGPPRTLELRDVDVRIPSLALLPPAPAPKSLKSSKDEDVPAGSNRKQNAAQTTSPALGRLSSAL